MKARRIIYATVLLLAVNAAGAAASVVKASFFSDALGTDKSYYIYLPPDYETNGDKRYPTVYLLHGYNFARNRTDQNLNQEEEAHWVVQEQVPRIAPCLSSSKNYDELLACLRDAKVDVPEGIVEAMKAEYPGCPLPLPDFIVVMPDGDSSFYANRLDGAKQWPPIDGPDFVDGTAKGATGQYETYIVKDLVAHIDTAYRTIADREHRGIGGFSMGGIGSMNLLLGNPDVFSTVTSLSALYNLTEMMTDPFSLSYMKGATPEVATIFCKDPSRGADCKFDKQYLMRNDPYYRLKHLERTDVHIYFDAGSDDAFAGRNNFETFKKFGALLKEKGIESSPANHVIPGGDLNRNGMHTAGYWRTRFGVMLTFFSKSFGLIK
jgi:S-formylglutathione hydrolase FrmB